jgi:hypothetical protein
MMTVSELINKANANGMHVRQSFTVLSKLDARQQELFLEGSCICCEGQAPAEGIWDMDCDEEGRVFGTCTGYEQELFCDGCVDTMPAEAMLKYELISQAEYDKLFDPDDYIPMDSNDLRDLRDPINDYGIEIKHHDVDNDDDLPF